MRYTARTFLSAFLFWIAAALLLAPLTQAQTVKCGNICSETWTQAGSPYIVTCNVSVVDPVYNCTLTIEAGTEVRFQAATSLIIEVDNVLNVQGTSGSPVTFTSDSGTPTSLDWTGIVLRTGSGTTMNYADVRYAGTCIYAQPTSSLTLAGGTIEDCGSTALHIRSATASITGVTVRNSNYGMHTYGGGTVDITSSTFTQNYTGINVGGDSNPAPAFTMHDSSIHDNYNWDLWAVGVSDPDLTVLDVRNNWWGATDTTTIRSHIADHADSEMMSPIADWCGFLDSPGGSPVTTYECPDLLVCDETDVWNVTSRPYLLASEVFVCPTGRLEVGPGVEVRAARHSELNILVDAGQIDVDASSGSATVFTTDDPTPERGDWKGFRVYRTIDVTPSLELKNVSIEYAFHGVEAYDDASVTLDTVEISESLQHGIFLHESSTASLTAVNSHTNQGSGLEVQENVTLSATGCTFTSNNAPGVSVQWYSGGSGSFAINDSSIHSNWGGYDVWTSSASNPDETVLDFKNNWWGTDVATTIQTRIADHVDNPSRPIVDWCPWLEAAPPAAVARDVECPELGVCSGTVRWDVTARPYLLVSDVYVCPTARLEIGPSVEVRSILTSSGIEILVDGELSVEGTEAAPVSFVSDQVTPYKTDWQGITLQGSSQSWFEYATVQHARNCIWAKGSATMSLADVAVTDCGPSGLYVDNDAIATMTNVVSSYNDLGLYIEDNATVRATGCTFTENQSYGAAVWGGSPSNNPTVVITGSNIHSNYGSHDFYANVVASPDTHIVWAPDNWWGTENETLITSRIYDHEDQGNCPRVYFMPYAADCEAVIGRDHDGDSIGDFEDNCPIDANAGQEDADTDGMGDPCDPYPGTAPTGDCDGTDDSSDGYSDADSDAWGDPCDHQPTRDDSHPMATDVCDARDNDGDPSTWVLDEYEDFDLDGNIDCYDCDDGDPDINSCNCENCTNIIDDDCDLLTDGEDPDCETSQICLKYPEDTVILTMGKTNCGEQSIRYACWAFIEGDAGQLTFSGGSVDLGGVRCYECNLSDVFYFESPIPNPDCDDSPLVFYLGSILFMGPDFGNASSGEPRDIYECVEGAFY